MSRQKWLLLAWYAAITVFVIIVMLPEAHAGDPPPPRPGQPNTDLFMYAGKPLETYLTVNTVQQLRETGVFRWRFDRNPSCAGDIRPAVDAALTDWAATEGIDLRYDATNGVLIYANCGPSFTAICGGGGVIGCLGRGYPYNLTTDISTDMAAFYDVSQIAIVCHEVCGHAAGLWNEMYQLNGSFAATPNWPDIMNTGPLSRMKWSDCTICIERWNRTMGPNSLKIVGQGRHADGTPYVYFCQPPERTTRVALLYDDGRGIYWAGRYADAGLDSNGCRGVLVDEAPGRTVYLKSESAVSWRSSFTEVVAGRF